MPTFHAISEHNHAAMGTVAGCPPCDRETAEYRHQQTQLASFNEWLSRQPKPVGKRGSWAIAVADGQGGIKLDAARSQTGTIYAGVFGVKTGTFEITHIPSGLLMDDTASTKAQVITKIQIILANSTAADWDSPEPTNLPIRHVGLAARRWTGYTAPDAKYWTS
jgi:hypothetical protein